MIYKIIIFFRENVSFHFLLANFLKMFYIYCFYKAILELSRPVVVFNE